MPRRIGGPRPGRSGAARRPRFGFYKYMKMDREEGRGGTARRAQRQAFLFLNPDGECPHGECPQRPPSWGPCSSGSVRYRLLGAG